MPRTRGSVLDLMKIYDQTCLALCEGQFLDISFEARMDVTVDEYLQMIDLKTASLIAAGVEAAATLASHDPAVIAGFRRFGERLGLAFQMADDVKGAFWLEAASGKAESGDLRRRKKTMPVIWALNHAAADDQARLRELFAPVEGERQLTDAEVAEALAILDRCGARETTLSEARRYRDEALAELKDLPLDPRRAGRADGVRGGHDRGLRPRIGQREAFSTGLGAGTWVARTLDTRRESAASTLSVMSRKATSVPTRGMRPTRWTMKPPTVS